MPAQSHPQIPFLQKFWKNQFSTLLEEYMLIPPSLKEHI